jgi:hypothetical protein
MDEGWEISTHHKRGYGRYNTEPRPHRCAEEVRDGDWNWKQCSRARGFGPDQAFCKQHDPQAVKDRRAARDAKWDADWEKKKKKWALHAIAPLAVEALQKIADGHNDPRTLALEVLRQYEGEE